MCMGNRNHIEKEEGKIVKESQTAYSSLSVCTG